MLVHSLPNKDCIVLALLPVFVSKFEGALMGDRRRFSHIEDKIGILSVHSSRNGIALISIFRT